MLTIWLLIFYSIFRTNSYWTPEPGLTFQYQLNDEGEGVDISIDADVFDIDLFDTPQSVIDDLHSATKKVICYFSTQYEIWRPDNGSFPDVDLGNNLDGWPGERWVNINSVAIRDIMVERIELAASKNCDGVDPDNVDEYTHTNGFSITPAEQLNFNEFLATTAHSNNLAVGLKNDDDQVADLHTFFDFAVVEQCFEYGECADYCPFVGDGKPIYEVEYLSEGGDPAVYCPQANAMGISTIQKTYDLYALPYFSCLQNYENAANCSYTCAAYSHTNTGECNGDYNSASAYVVSFVLLYFVILVVIV